MPGRPYFPFYPSDWRGDVRLAKCSLASRGLWIEMIGIMHEATPYGHLVDEDGASIDAADLATLIRSTPKEVSTLLAELERRKVFDRTESGTILSRRMIRDEAKREAERVRKSSGKAAGNPPGTPLETHDDSGGESGGSPRAPSPESNSNVQDHIQPSSSSARATEQSSVTETTTAVRTVAESAALDFARWFAREGLKRLAIPPHVVMDEFAWAYKQLTPAEQLIENYSREECERRAIRLMDAVRNKKIRRGCNIQSLADCWDWSMIDADRPIIRDTPSPQSAGPVQNATPYKELPPAPKEPPLTEEQIAENRRRLAEMTARLVGPVS